MPLTIDVHHHILPDFFWRETNDQHAPVGGIAPAPWSRDSALSFMDDAEIDIAVTSISRAYAERQYVFSHAGGTIPYLATRFGVVDQMGVIPGPHPSPRQRRGHVPAAVLGHGAVVARSGARDASRGRRNRPRVVRLGLPVLPSRSGGRRRRELARTASPCTASDTRSPI